MIYKKEHGLTITPVVHGSALVISFQKLVKIFSNSFVNHLSARQKLVYVRKQTTNGF